MGTQTGSQHASLSKRVFFFKDYFIYLKGRILKKQRDRYSGSTSSLLKWTQWFGRAEARSLEVLPALYMGTEAQGHGLSCTALPRAFVRELIGCDTTRP